MKAAVKAGEYVVLPARSDGIGWAEWAVFRTVTSDPGSRRRAPASSRA